ncbi:MAG: tripartite tricarboxylate transporter TctB family protein [Rubrivivax sp.]|nr:tripartite tricarboxylate transporter TctB family protein [Rubrivivax sp.]
MAKEDGSPQRSGLSHSTVDAIAAAIIIAIGVVMMVTNHKIGAGWASDGPESGYFPFRIGAILCLASVVVMFRSRLGKQRRHDIFVSWERFKRVLQVLLPTALYVLAIQFLGIYVASTLFIGAFMRVMDKSSWLKTLLVSLGVNGTLFWMFEIQFKVPLPKGPLEALFGY